MDREQVLVQAGEFLLEHGVISGRIRDDAMVFFDAGDAGDGHILGDFHGIGAPRRDHGSTWADEGPRELGLVQHGLVSEEPAEFVQVFFFGHFVCLDGENLCGRLTEEKDHDERFLQPRKAGGSSRKFHLFIWNMRMWAGLLPECCFVQKRTSTGRRIC